MPLLNKAMNIIATVADDCHAIAMSPLPPKKKARLFFTYWKIVILHNCFERLINLQKVSFLSFTIETFNYDNFYFLFREIFVQGNYYAPLKSPKLIIDCGANIGMSVLYFKWLWPEAVVECFEPDAVTFKLLKKNIERNHVAGVHLYEQAVSDQDGEIDFYANADNPGSLKMSTIQERIGDTAYGAYKVKTTDFSRFLQGRSVDMLKMDIEGAEYGVIKHLATKNVLQAAPLIILEYHHNIPNHKQQLSYFLKVFEDAGYEYVIDAASKKYQEQASGGQDVLLHLTRTAKHAR